MISSKVNYSCVCSNQAYISKNYSGMWKGWRTDKKLSERSSTTCVQISWLGEKRQLADVKPALLASKKTSGCAKPRVITSMESSQWKAHTHKLYVYLIWPCGIKFIHLIKETTTLPQAIGGKGEEGRWTREHLWEIYGLITLGHSCLM